MRVETTFAVGAPPDRTFGLLLQVREVAACLPGAEIVEVLGPETYRGRLRLRVGALQLLYEGTARVVDRSSEEERTLHVSVEGADPAGQGDVRATVTVSVAEAPGGRSTVRAATDIALPELLAQIGQGIITDIVRRIVDELGVCIDGRLRTLPDEPGAASPTP